MKHSTSLHRAHLAKITKIGPLLHGGHANTAGPDVAGRLGPDLIALTAIPVERSLGAMVARHLPGDGDVEFAGDDFESAPIRIQPWPCVPDFGRGYRMADLNTLDI
jgi:hypothetical protein